MPAFMVLVDSRKQKRNFNIFNNSLNYIVLMSNLSIFSCFFSFASQEPPFGINHYY